MFIEQFHFANEIEMADGQQKNGGLRRPMSVRVETSGIEKPTELGETWYSALLDPTPHMNCLLSRRDFIQI